MAEEEQQELVEVGALIRDRWKVVKKLGEGGFGAVFEVYDMSIRESAALKVESAKERNQVLKMEVAVLRRLQGKPHVCRFLGCGRNEKFNYVVMGIVGKNLADCKRDTKDQKLSVGSGTRVCYQCLRALEDLHTIGFLHRDVKPGNYAMGKSDPHTRTVFILDFGLARQYVNNRGEIRTPRAAAGFRGTVRYASLSAHRNKEMGREADVWCLFYMTIEFINGTLPWRKLSDKDQCGRMKETISQRELLGDIPEEYMEFHKHLQGLKYPDKPDYAFLYSIIDRILKRFRVRQSDPFDWETGKPGGSTNRGGRPKSPKDQMIRGPEEDDNIEGGMPAPW